MTDREAVHRFMHVAGQETPDTPGLPPIDEEMVADLLALANTLQGFESVFKNPQRLSKHPGSGLVALRMRLIVSELKELAQALAAEDLVEVADALADLRVVTLGTDIAFGIPDAVFAEVMASNMAKFPECNNCLGRGYHNSGTCPTCEVCGGKGRIAIKDAGGKVQKPPGWTPPDIAKALQVKS